MKILIINGPNLNMLGIREPEIYGNKSYKDLCKFIKDTASKNNDRIKIFQSNSEEKIINKIQKAYGKYDWLIINGGAFTHTSIAILDAIKSINIPTIEVHLSDPDTREEFRKTNYIRLVAKASFVGKGFESYSEALNYIHKN